ncbi:hypothetical protein JTB14_008688 [Gonioctena quinquepunctata]|nr:hypothetical protein JTB14_008688 [Gonioctena quinquepunctata]
METVPTEEYTDHITKTMNKPKGNTQNPGVRNRNKVPPIVIERKIISQLTAVNLRKFTKEQFIIEHTPRNTMIYAKSNEDRLKLMETLQSLHYQFHTYTLREEKTHAFILKGLDQGPTQDEIKEHNLGHKGTQSRCS